MKDDTFKTNPESAEEREKSDSDEMRGTSSAETSAEKTDAETKNTYQFINQVIREKPRSHKAQVMRVLSVIGIGVAIGAISAFVHAGIYPVARRAFGADK